MSENTLTYDTRSPEETTKAAEKFAGKLCPDDIVLYTGDLGAGKTHFTKGIAKYFGYSPDLVTSPTFTLVNEYRGEKAVIYHLDLYRLTGADDLFGIGFWDYLDCGAIVCAEWSENIPGLAEMLANDPAHERGVYIIDIAVTGDSLRRITETRVKRGKE